MNSIVTEEHMFLRWPSLACAKMGLGWNGKMECQVGGNHREKQQIKR